VAVATITRDERAATPPPTQVSGEGAHYRADVDGLRAVAILLVVLYHCRVPGFHNGFVGVDVFFVISGFVITAGLLGEIDRTDRVHVLRFWARRVLRLMPAATLMILVVLLVGQRVYSALESPRLTSDAFAATLYRANFHFAGDGSGYFDQVAPSPLLHTWSLAVEEQFYLFWPVLLLVVQRLWPRSRRALLVGVAALTVGSFVVLVSSHDHQTVFYSPLARAWEFGAGALVALTPTVRRSATRAWAMLGAGAVGVIASALILVDPARFPSAFTALPVVGTAVLISAGARSGASMARLLGTRGLVRLGRLSYAWYLWHWPVLVFATHRSATMSWPYRALIGVAALVPAWLTHVLIENPIRHNRRLRESGRRTVVGIVTCAAVAAATLSMASVYDHTRLDDPLLSALRRAQSDHESFTAECASVEAPVLLEGCSHGDQNARELVLVLGDSHALQWLPALDPAARDLGLRLTLSVLGSCPAIDVRSADETPGCDERRAQIPALIDTLRPDLVVLAHSQGYLDTLVAPGDGPADISRPALWQTALADFATSLKARDIPLLVMLDTPRYGRDPLECAARRRDPQACSLTRSEAESNVALSHDSEIAALERAGYGEWMNPLPLLCDGNYCPLVTDSGVVTYHDEHHLTSTYTTTLSPALTRELSAVLNVGQ
jgi:peptidoglycan/LPS O-acetylase OafA/YrhL